MFVGYYGSSIAWKGMIISQVKFITKILICASGFELVVTISVLTCSYNFGHKVAADSSPECALSPGR